MSDLPSIVVYQSGLEKIEHSALLYVGFQQLERAGVIHFSILRMPRDLSEFVGGDDLVVCGLFRQRGRSGAIRFAVDLRDRPDRVNEALLHWADAYFKRSIQPAKRIGASPELQKKVHLYGLNFAARDKLSAKDSISLLKNLASSPVLLVLARMKVFVALPVLSQFEQPASAPVIQGIIFQTRVWTASEVPLGDSEALNEKRVSLVHNLRKQFGSRFQGGLVPNPLAISRYPQYISNLASKRRSYAQVAKQNLIGIYSEGLSDSTAFKFLEYLAGSQCIVAEQIANQLPIGCEAGRNYLEFQSMNVCLESCERLLTNRKEASAMRIENEQFYKNTASPKARASNMLSVLQRI
jgi:hypothetical protein